MAFDAELYLRLAGERMLLDQASSRGSWDSPVVHAARALVAAAVIDADAAQAVADDYDLAVQLRYEDGAARHRARFRRAGHGSRARRAPALKPRRVVACEQVIELPAAELRVRFVTLSDDTTLLSAVIRQGRPSGRPHRTAGRGSHWSPPQVTLTDDQGTTSTAHFGGGGTDEEWRGHFTAATPLARDTRWIEVDGHRIELDRELPTIEVTVQQLPVQDPAMTYLWRQLAVSEHFHHSRESLEVAVDALVAAGAVDPDAQEIADLRSVRAALDHATPRGGIRALPEPWRSLLARRGAAGGPSREVVIGAVTPEFDGISVAVMSMETDEEGFEIEVETTGGRQRTFPFDTTIGDTGVAWWAADDRGNHYLGEIGNWGGSDQHSEGDINYWPALDPKAARLDLMPTAKTARAVIAVPLPRAAAGAPR
jgi:hypothetical protein